MSAYQFWTYILTNYNRTVLYTGITNNLARRLVEHWIGSEGAFTTRYNVHFLVFAEETKYVLNAIDLEKKVKLMKRSEKDALIADRNPECRFMNEAVLGNWPPTEAQLSDTRLYWSEQFKLREPEKMFFHRQLFKRNDETGLFL